MIKLPAETMISYKALSKAERKNVDCVASVVANTILYNLAFIPDDIKMNDYTKSIIVPFATTYITQFTTPDNIWHEETPLKALDLTSISLTLELVIAILLKNDIPLNLSTDIVFPQPYILDGLGGNIGFDEVTRWIFINEIRINSHATALLVSIERYMSNITGTEVRYLYRSDIVVDPDDYKIFWQFDI